MIVYITGSTYGQVIKNTVEATEELVVQTEIAEEVDILTYVRNNLVNFESIEKIIIDISVCKNSHEEILKALEMIRTLYDELRIIVFAPYMETGTEFLANCFHIGIMNIINTNDFKIIKEELLECIKNGKKYKDASVYKNIKPDRLTIKHEIKKMVNNHLIGVAGTQNRIGTTHFSIMLANFFRKKGFMVALLEMNASEDFESILEEFGEREFEEGYFTLNGVNFYKNVVLDKLHQIEAGAYNFIIIDFGTYENCDLVTFHRCHEKMIIGGSKPWELKNVNNIFNMAGMEVLKEYIFYFNFSLPKDQADIRTAMLEFQKVHFLNIDNDPFYAYQIPDAEKVFKEYLPDKVQEEKKGFFRKKGIKKQHEKKKSNVV